MMPPEIKYEDVGLMFNMPPLVKVTTEEAERLKHEFGMTNIQKILVAAVARGGNQHIIKHRAFFDDMMVYDAARVGNALYWDGGKGFDAFAFVQKTPAILMDYIGYRDNLGKEIYEADILTDEYNRRMLVEWHQGGFTFRALTETNFLRTRMVAEWFAQGEPKPVVLGNAYEDPAYMGGGT